MSRTFTYVVYRNGSNGANQSEHRLAVGFYDAPNRDAACEAALADGITCYNNQYLDAVPASKAPASDIRDLCEFGGEAERQAADDADWAAYRAEAKKQKRQAADVI